MSRPECPRPGMEAKAQRQGPPRRHRAGRPFPCGQAKAAGSRSVLPAVHVSLRRQGTPCANRGYRSLCLGLLLGAGWGEGAAAEDVARLGIARGVELLEEVSSRKPFVA